MIIRLYFRSQFRLDQIVATADHHRYMCQLHNLGLVFYYKLDSIRLFADFKFHQIRLLQRPTNRHAQVYVQISLPWIGIRLSQMRLDCYQIIGWIRSDCCNGRRTDTLRYMRRLGYLGTLSYQIRLDCCHIPLDQIRLLQRPRNDNRRHMCRLGYLGLVFE